MLSRPLFRFVRDDKRIPFMRGRYAGLATSAILSLLSVVLFFSPGLKLGLDFRGGIVVEARYARSCGFRQASCRAGSAEYFCSRRAKLWVA